MIAALMTVTLSRNKTVDVERSNVTTRYLGEGAIEVAKKQLQTAVANWDPVPETGTVTINGENVTYTIVPTGVPTGLDAVSTDSAGIQTLITGYEIRAVAQVNNSSQVLHRVLNTESTPIFQFAVFYTDDLEINPGPSMTLGGRVHSNGDMYLGCGGTLTVDTNYLRAVGTMHRSRKDNPSSSSGTVKIREWVSNPYNASEPESYVKMLSKSQLSGEGVTSVGGYDSDFTAGLDLDGDGSFTGTGEWLPWGPGALDFWNEPDGYSDGYGNTVQDQAHNVGEAVSPHIGSIAMYEEAAAGSYKWDAGTDSYAYVGAGAGTHDPGFFHGEADLSILTYADGTWDAFDGTGTSVKSLLGATIVQSSLYDARQSGGTGDNTAVTILDIDVLNSSGFFPTNGLVYMAHYGMGQGTDAKGVLITNGSELKGPLTVVSEGSLYIQGDFNTVDKKGASVIGDAVNLLSNSWDGTKTAGNLPSASETTFNAAIVTGNHDTSVGHYNGGLENLPRFHEKWSGVDCNINGSFVNTWTSEYATGEWRYGSDRYTAPGRKWSYDTSFNTVANLPPYTPMAVSARDVVSW